MLYANADDRACAYPVGTKLIKLIGCRVIPVLYCSACACICTCVCACICMHVCIFLQAYVCVSVYLSIHLSISIYLSIYLGNKEQDWFCLLGHIPKCGLWFLWIFFPPACARECVRCLRATSQTRTLRVEVSSSPWKERATRAPCPWGSLC